MNSGQRYIKHTFHTLIILSIGVGLLYIDITAARQLWVENAVVICMILFLANLVYLNHLTHKHYGTDTAQSFFHFPINLITALATIVCFWQISMESNQSKVADRLATMHDLSIFSNDIIVDVWDSQTMNDAMLWPLYSATHNLKNNERHSLLRQDWLQSHPNLPFVPYEGNEIEWHYSVKFCQQMINIIRMFNLTERFKLNQADQLEISQKGTYAGWLTCFRMFLKSPTVRSAWEQNKTLLASPMITAWITYYVTDVIDNEPEFFKNHAKMWQENTDRRLAHREPEGISLSEDAQVTKSTELSRLK